MKMEKIKNLQLFHAHEKDFKDEKSLSDQDLKKFADFSALLIKINQQIKRKERYEKNN